MILKILIDVLCGSLNALGGWHILWMRRYLMPVVLGAGVSVVTHIWWLGLMILPVMGTLCLGYFKDGNAGRALWLFIQAIVIGLGITMTGHLAWYFYLIYAIGAGVLGGLYKNWQQILGDSITGIYLGSIIFLVR